MKWCKFLWLALWIISMIGISYYGGTVSYGFFFALTLLPVISLTYLFFVYLHFKIYQKTESRDMVCGQPIPYYFVLRNESFFGFAGIKVQMFSDFSYIENMEEDIEYELLPGDEFRYETKITCKYRGEYQIGVKEVIITDFFRIFHLRYRIPETIHAIVHPKLVELQDVSELSQLSATLQQITSMDKREPDVVVRDYIQGDSLKKIHWKASAREQKLKIRPDIDEGKQNVCILFDTKRYSKRMEEYLPLESKILETLLALGLFFVKKNVQVSTLYRDSVIQKNTMANIRRFEQFYVQMSNISFQPEGNPTLVFEECYSMGLFMNTKVLICIFHELNNHIMQLAEQISAQGTMILLYAITDENIDKYIKENTSRKKVIAIPPQAELEGTL